MFQGMRYVYEVYREMSFSKAARNLFISQPSLSAAVKKEEAEIGFPVFDRSSNPIRLTDLGREYIRTVEMILNVESGFENYVNDIRECKSGSISVGGTNLFASFMLPPLLSRFTELYPAIHVNLVEASTAELSEKLFSGSLDLLVDNQMMNSAVYGSEFLCEEHLLLAVPARFASNEKVAGYALSAADIRAGRHLDDRVLPVPLEVFKDDPFLLLKNGNDTRTRAEKICLNCGHFTPKIRLEPEQQITAYNLASYGMGISFNGDILIHHVPESQSLLYYKLDMPYASRDVNFYYKRNRYMTKPVREFLNGRINF